MRNPVKLSKLEELVVMFDHFLSAYHAWALHEIEHGHGPPEAYHLQRTDIGVFLEWWLKYPERLTPPSPESKNKVIMKCTECGDEIERSSNVKNPICFYCKSEKGRMYVNRKNLAKRLKRKK